MTCLSFLVADFSFNFGMVRERGLRDTVSLDFIEACFLAFKRSMFIHVLYMVSKNVQSAAIGGRVYSCPIFEACHLCC